MEQKAIKQAVKPAVPLNLNLNLRVFAFVGIIPVIYLALLGRGMYFRPELLPGLMLVSLIFAAAVGHIVVSGETDFFRFPVDYLATVLPVVYLLSFFGAVSRPDAAMGLMKGIAYLMVFFITTQAVRTWRAYRGILAAIYVSGVAVALIGILAAAGVFAYPGAYVEKSLLSTLQYENALAIFMVVTSFLALSLWDTLEKSPLKELWYLAGLILLNVALLGTKSRAVWLMYPVLLLVWNLGLDRRNYFRAFLRISYTLVASMLVSRGFFARVEAGHGQAALLLLIGGLLVCMSGWLLLNHVNRYIRRRQMGPTVKKFWQAVGIAYFVMVLAAYAIYSVKTLPGGVNELVPDAVVQQVSSVSSSDRSFQQRFVFYGDALTIIGDHPWIGTGAGGWQTLYYKYRSRPYISAEVHNQFLQVGVETGIPGMLIYLAIWGVTIYSAYRLFRYLRHDENWSLAWGVIIAVLATGLHSAFDFTLSIPALSILTWVLLGLVRNSRQLSYRKAPGFSLGSLRWPVLGVGLVYALLLAVPSYRFYNAGQLGAEGARAMSEGNIVLAEEKMQAAAQSDPLTGSYLADLAKINMVHWLNEGDQARMKQSLKLVQEAARKEPYSIQLKAALISTYMAARMKDQGITEARNLVAANPYEIRAYEVLAGTSVDAALYFKKAGAPAKALIALNRALLIPADLDIKRAKVLKESGVAYRYADFLKITPQLSMVLGEAYMLKGEPGKGIPYLEKGLGNQTSAREAAAWLVVAYKKTGQSDKADRLLKKWENTDKGFHNFTDAIDQVLK